MKDLSLMTWKEIKQTDKEKSIVFAVLAPIEEHGPCLPLAFRMRTCLPVKQTGGNDVIEVYEEKCLHIHFTEGFSKVGRAHIPIKEYMDANKIGYADRVYEVYNNDMSVDVYYALT